MEKASRSYFFFFSSSHSANSERCSTVRDCSGRETNGRRITGGSGGEGAHCPGSRGGGGLGGEGDRGGRSTFSRGRGSASSDSRGETSRSQRLAVGASRGGEGLRACWSGPVRTDIP